MQFSRLQWLFPIAVTLHNTEEFFAFPKWSARQELPIQVSAGAFRFALVVLIVAAFIVTYLSSRKGKLSLWAYLLFGYIVAMLVNIFVPHIPASIVFLSYTPGVATAVLINLPLMSFLALRAVREGWVSSGWATTFAIVVPVGIALLIPVLFLIGEQFLH